MAEVTLGAIGLIGLASVFNSCVESFNFIKLGRKFSNDYEASGLELDLVQLRLSRWGEAVNIYGGSPHPDEQLIARILANISNAIEKAQQISEKYAAKHNVIDQDLYDIRDVNELGKRFKGLMVKRQREAKLSKKTTWALYEKTDFNELVQQTSRLVEQLVTLFPAPQPVQAQLCAQDLATLSPSANAQEMRIISGASANVDSDLNKAARQVLEKLGHTYRKNRVHPHANVIFGDVGQSSGEGARRHLYDENEVDSDANVVGGNMHNGLPEGFFRHRD